MSHANEMDSCAHAHEIVQQTQFQDTELYIEAFMAQVADLLLSPFSGWLKGSSHLTGFWGTRTLGNLGNLQQAWLRQYPIVLTRSSGHEA